MSEIKISPAEVISRQYSIEIEVDDALAIFKAESVFNRVHIRYEDSLCARLEGITVGCSREPDVEGVSGVEYDPMFGPGISFTINADDDTPELHDKIIEIIREQISDARRVVALCARKMAHEKLMREREYAATPAL